MHRGQTEVSEHLWMPCLPLRQSPFPPRVSNARSCLLLLVMWSVNIGLNTSSCKLLPKWDVLPLLYVVHLSASWQVKWHSLTTLWRWTVVQKFKKVCLVLVHTEAFYILTEDFSIHTFFREDGMRNHRITEWFRGDHKDHLGPTTLPRAGTLFTKSCCSKPHPT